MPIKLENESKRSGGSWIFRDVTFEVADGEVFGIFGPNGSGKSELLSCISGRSDTGSFLARFFNKDEKTAAARFERLRNEITSANGSLFLDDPFSGLDKGTQKEIAGLIRKVSGERGVAVIFSTPAFADILLAADRAALLASGYIQQIGTPHELYEEPVNCLAAIQTGNNNLIEARRLTSSRSEMPEFQTIKGEHRIFTQKVDLRSLGAINKNATLAIRPEQISLSFGASFPEDNLLKAVIREIHFNGATTAVSLDCSGLELEAMVMRLVGLNIGDECMVGLPPDRILVLPD